MNTDPRLPRPNLRRLLIIWLAILTLTGAITYLSQTPPPSPSPPPVEKLAAPKGWNIHGL